MSDNGVQLPGERPIGGGTSAPSVKICTVDGQYVRLRSLPAEDVMALVEAYEQADGVGAYDLDDGRSQVYVAWATVARVDVDWELGLWSRFTTWVLSKLDRYL